MSSKFIEYFGIIMPFLGDKPWERKVELGSWERGEKYIADIIEVADYAS